MKTLPILTFIILMPVLFFGQNPVVEQGESLVEQSLELYDKYFAEGKYKEAGQYAHNAYEAAGKLGQIEKQAVALNRRGRALMKIPNAKNAALNRAFKSFEESNELTAKQPLKLDNLENMLVLAKRLRKRKDVARLKAAIAVMKGEKVYTDAEEKVEGLFNRRKKAKKEYDRVMNEREELAESLSELSEEQALMREQQTALVDLIQEKESAIQEMNDEQMRQELLVLEQARLLDSMFYETMFDSLELEQAEMLMARQNDELERQKIELDLQQSQQNLFLSIAAAIAALILLVAVAAIHRYYSVRRHNAVLAEKNNIIGEERERSESLLLNILPAVIADELKKKGVATTQFYEEATVMFVDFKGFSHIAQKLPAEQLVAELDHAFKNFDEIIDHHGLEKIKTIGDEYMCAGGVPAESEGHPLDMVKAAFEIQSFLKNWNTEKRTKNQPLFEARIGIHTGPLIAGVVGSKKFAYDVWGDTVNVASRMESKSEAGRVNISATTYARIKNEFDCEYRGKVPAKNVGEVEMYYVNGAKK